MLRLWPEKNLLFPRGGTHHSVPRNVGFRAAECYAAITSRGAFECREPKPSEVWNGAYTCSNSCKPILFRRCTTFILQRIYPSQACCEYYRRWNSSAWFRDGWLTAIIALAASSTPRA